METPPPKPPGPGTGSSPTLARRRIGTEAPPAPAAAPQLVESPQRLQELLRGAVRALTEVLAVVDPSSYAQALRVQATARDLAQALSLSATDGLEAAALLAPLGRISLPTDLLRRLHENEPLDADEQRIVAAVPQLTDRLLAPIPGLEEVRAVILLHHGRAMPVKWRDALGDRQCERLALFAEVLRIAGAFDALQARGYAVSESLSLLRSESTYETLGLVKALASLYPESAAPRVELRSLPLRHLRPGMVIAEAVYTQAGQLLVNRGFEITDSFLERVRNFRRGLVREPVQVMLPPPPGPARTFDA